MFARQSSTRSSRTNPLYPNFSLQRGSEGGRTCVWMSMLLMLLAALATGCVGRIAPEVLEHRRQLLDDVGEVERLAVKLGAAFLADPEEGIALVGQPAPLDHQPHRVRPALRRVRRVGRKQEYFALLDGDLYRLSLLQHAQDDVPFDLIEEFLAFIDVIIGARVGPTHHHHDEIAVPLPDLRVAHGRLQEMAVLVDPLVEIERLHVRISAMHFNSMAMGVGSAPTSTVVRQGRASRKYSAYNLLYAAKSRFISVRNTVTSTRSSQRAPASSSTARTLSNTDRHCASMSYDSTVPSGRSSPPGISCDPRLRGPIPERKSSPPARRAWGYAPTGSGGRAGRNSPGGPPTSPREVLASWGR